MSRPLHGLRLPRPEGPPLPSKPVSVLPARLGLPLMVPTPEFHSTSNTSPPWTFLTRLQAPSAAGGPCISAAGDLHTGGSLQPPGEGVADGRLPAGSAPGKVEQSGEQHRAWSGLLVPFLPLISLMCP